MENTPIIEIKFTTWYEMQEQVAAIYVKSIGDAITIARGNKDALNKLQLALQNANATVDNYLSDIKYGHLKDKEELAYEGL